MKLTALAMMSTRPMLVNSSMSSRHWCRSAGLAWGSSLVFWLISWLKKRLSIKRLSASLLGWIAT
ncbi:hypothetical protein D9M68_877170 [compost metagenome]